MFVEIHTVPEGFNATLSSNVIPVGGQVVMSIEMVSASVGEYTIGIRSSSSSRILSACIHVKVHYVVPPQPICPADGSTNWNTNVTYSWAGNSEWYFFFFSLHIES